MEICQNLKLVLVMEVVDYYLVVSCFDFILWGYYFLEIDVINWELGLFDVYFLVLVFFEGGRVIKDSVYYLIVDGELVFVVVMEFVQDLVFGYYYSYLFDYVVEKI